MNAKIGFIALIFLVGIIFSSASWAAEESGTPDELKSEEQKTGTTETVVSEADARSDETESEPAPVEVEDENDPVPVIENETVATASPEPASYEPTSADSEVNEDTPSSGSAHGGGSTIAKRSPLEETPQEPTGEGVEFIPTVEPALLCAMGGNCDVTPLPLIVVNGVPVGPLTPIEPCTVDCRTPIDPCLENDSMACQLPVNVDPCLVNDAVNCQSPIDPCATQDSVLCQPVSPQPPIDPCAVNDSVNCQPSVTEEENPTIETETHAPLYPFNPFWGKKVLQLSPNVPPAPTTPREGNPSPGDGRETISPISTLEETIPSPAPPTDFISGLFSATNAPWLGILALLILGIFFLWRGQRKN